VPRPGYEQLIAELDATNFCAVGRKYGVSGTAVRKWVRWYEAERERVAASGAVGSAGSEDVESGAEPAPGRSPETA
jgi:transposase-like protein